MLLLSFLEVGSLGFWLLLGVSAVIVSSLVDDERPGTATVVALGTFALLALLGNLNPLVLVRDHPREALLAVPAYLAVGVFWGYLKWTLFVGAAGRKADAAKQIFLEGLAEYRKGIEEEKEELDSRTRSTRGKQEQAQARMGNTEGASREETGWSRANGPRSVLANLQEELLELEASASRLKEREEKLGSDSWRQARWQSATRSAGITGEVKPMVRANKTRVLAWMTYWPASMTWTLIDDPVRRAFLALYDGIGGSLQRISDRRFAGFDEVYKASPRKGAA